MGIMTYRECRWNGCFISSSVEECCYWYDYICPRSRRMSSRRFKESCMQGSWWNNNDYVNSVCRGTLRHILAYSPSRPVCMRLSSWRMKVPGSANKGRKRVTSLRYVQIIPSPRVGSGVDVLHTAMYVSWILRSMSDELTFHILEGKYTKPVKLSTERRLVH